MKEPGDECGEPFISEALSLQFGKNLTDRREGIIGRGKYYGKLRYCSGSGYHKLQVHPV
jgi:hypothetical protein